MAICFAASTFVVPAFGGPAAVAGVAIERVVRAAPQPVGVIAPAGSRLAGELKRELAAAKLTSVSMVARDSDWPAEMTDLVSLPYLQGVVVGSNDGRMIVFSRAATTGRVEVRFELSFDPNDHPARRRACLAVVEGLRVLGDTTPPPPAAPDEAPAQAPSDGVRDRDLATAAEGVRDLAPGPASAEGARHLVADVAGAGRFTLGPARPVPAEGGRHLALVTGAQGAGTAQGATAQGATAQGATAQGTPSQGARHLAMGAHAEAAAPVATATEGVAGGAVLGAADGGREPWVMGVATMLDVDRGLASPMGHLKFMWFIPVGARLAFRAQAMWPLTGTQLRADGTDVQVWTFGAAIGLQYSFAPARARFRPFAGLATGSQILLTDTSAADADKGRSLFVPSANLRAQSGVRYAVASRVQLLGELEATRDWLIQSRRQPVYRDSAANAIAFHASLGVLFEY